MNPKKKLKKLKRIRVLLLFFIVLPLGKLSAEEVSAEVIRLSAQSSFSWTISNSLDHTVYSSIDYINADTAHIWLDGEQRFRLNLQLDSVAEQDSDLLVLQVNGAPIMLVNADIGVGEFSYPFVTGSKEPVLKIIGGTDASISEVPWQVYFSAGNYACGGSIISKHWILTAAHCTQDGDNEPILAGRMKVKVGTSTPYSQNSGKWYYVEKYIVHEAYDNDAIRNDIALLKLYDDIDFENAEIIELVSVEDVDSGATDPGVMSLVSGWGLTNVDPEESPAHLQKTQLPLISNETAESVWGPTPNSILMAGYSSGGKDACNGDSGGPLVVAFGESQKLAGVVSWGSKSCNTYGAFTRVSYYLDWIEENMREKLDQPSGDKKICNSSVMSVYTTSVAEDNTFEWKLSPDTAGTISFDNNTAEVLWNLKYSGIATLGVRADIESIKTSWSYKEVELGEATRLLSYTEDVEVCEGDVSELYVEASGANLVYNWYKDGVSYTSSSSSSLAFNNSETFYSGEYYCVVSGTCGDTTTGTFNLTVYPNTLVNEVSESQTYIQGEEATLRVEAAGHENVYEWYKNDNYINGANANILSLDAVDANDIGIYQVVVSGTCLNDTSDYIYVYVDHSADDETQVRLWPSVVEDDFYIAISNNDNYRVEVYNNSGVIIYSQKDCFSQTQINTSAWLTGNYLVKIISADITETLRMLKQ